MSPILLNYFKISTILMLVLSAHTIQAAPNQSETCSGTLLTPSFNTNSGWSICFTTTQQEGLSLQTIKYRTNTVTRRILGSASLAQLETVLDEKINTSISAVTRLGFGGDRLQTLSQADCPQGTLYPDANGRAVVCALTQKDGLIYKYAYQAQRAGSYFELFSISQLTPTQNFIQRWRFYENGVIEPALGFNGKLPKITANTTNFGKAVSHQYTATGITHYLGWRLDFDLGQDSTNDTAEEISSVSTISRRQRVLKTEELTQEIARNLDPEVKRTWRIKDTNELNADGRPVSYEIVPTQYYQSSLNLRNRPWLNNDIYFTQYHDCERFASDNTSQTDCGKNVQQYIQNKESISKADIVVWYKQAYHYLPRSDDSDYLSTEWVSFQLMPRDWNAVNPL